MLDMEFHAEGRKVALIINNSPVHSNVYNLKAIELIFLPTHTTSKTQPMDQGFIRALKTFYRLNFERRQIKYINADETISNINILDAMCILVRSWDAAFSNTGKKCFRKAGILQETQVASIEDEDDPSNCLQQMSMSLNQSRGLIDEDLAVDD